MRRSSLFALVVVSALACTTEEGPTDDAGVDGGADVLVTPPDIPWLADGVPPLEIVPCPDGWRAVTDAAGITTCDPYPEGGALSCGDGEAHFPGEPGCRPIGDSCPAGPWPEDLPASGVVFIQEGAVGGDGSRTAPFGTFGQASLSTRGAGTVIALAKGTYDGVLALRAGVTVVGACAAETRLTGTDAPATAVITVTSAGEPATVRNLTVVDPPQSGVGVEDGRALVLEGVRISGATLLGILSMDAGTRIDATDLVVDDTRRPSGQPHGHGILVRRGAEFHATRLLVRRSAEVGIIIAEGAATALVDAVVRDSVNNRGISLQESASLSGTRILITANRGAGIGTLDDCTITLEDAIISNQMPNTFSGRGISLEEGSVLDASRMVVSGNHETGIHIGGAGVRATLQDVVVRDTQPDLNNGGIFGRGITVQGSAVLEATRVVISGNRLAGVFGAEAGSALTLTDALIRDTLPQESDGQDGRGLALQSGARAFATRLVVRDSRELGVRAGNPDTSLVLEDVLVEGTLPEPDGRFGYGVLAQDGASIEATRLRVVDVRELGVVAFDEATFVGRDVEVDTVERSSFEGPRRIHGHGVVASGAVVTLDRFTISDTATCGLFVSDYGPLPGSLDVAHGLVQRAAIGACVQIEGYDLARLRGEVVYQDNGTNLDTTMLPVPEPPVTL